MSPSTGRFRGSEYPGSGEDAQDLWVFQPATPRFCVASGLGERGPLGTEARIAHILIHVGQALRLHRWDHAKLEVKAFLLSVVMLSCSTRMAILSDSSRKVRNLILNCSQLIQLKNADQVKKCLEDCGQC